MPHFYVWLSNGALCIATVFINVTNCVPVCTRLNCCVCHSNECFIHVFWTIFQCFQASTFPGLWPSHEIVQYLFSRNASHIIPYFLVTSLCAEFYLEFIAWTLFNVSYLMFHVGKNILFLLFIAYWNKWVYYRQYCSWVRRYETCLRKICMICET